MARYLFIESRDAFDCADAPRLFELIAGVRERRHDTTLFLVQNGVLAVREGALPAERIAALARAGVHVLADAFSLRERAIDATIEGVAPTDIDALVRLLLEPGTRAIWH